MNRYAELRHRQQEEFNALPLGFAFSQKQFDEMMQGWGLDPEKDLDKILRIPGGGYVQKRTLTCSTRRRSATIRKWRRPSRRTRPGRGFIYEMFLYELDNHEYGYTRDTEDTLDALGYTAEEILGDPCLKRGIEKAVTEICKREGD